MQPLKVIATIHTDFPSKFGIPRQGGLVDALKATVTYDGRILSIDRKGETASHLILEQGVRHECLYSTPMGQMFIGIFTDIIKADVNESGGEISAAYQLDFNRTAVSYNEFYISIKKK